MVDVLQWAQEVQWSLSIKDTLNKGRLSNKDSVCRLNHIELCTNLLRNSGHLSMQDSQLGPNGVHYRKVPLYWKGGTGLPQAGADLLPTLLVSMFPAHPILPVCNSNLCLVSC